jgi:hypothetical protein
MSKLQISNSTCGKFYRRTFFFLQYVLAKANPKIVLKLLPAVEKIFNHPWVAEVKLEIRSSSGYDGAQMNWDAPIAISVYRKKRGNKRSGFCMSLYILNGILYIKQMQAIHGTVAPPELKSWPIMLMETCKQVAIEEKLKAVRVASVGSLYSFHYPCLSHPNLLVQDLGKIVLMIRANMEMIYDKSALLAGFVPDGDWFTWINSGYYLKTRRSLASRFFT